MIVLDTNVVSEVTCASPEPRVLAWLDRQDVHSLFVTVVTEAEIRTSIALLLTGWRRDGLAAAADRTFDELFSSRVLPFDAAAARGVCRDCGQPARRPLSHQSGRLPDRGDCALARDGGCDARFRGLGGLWG